MKFHKWRAGKYFFNPFILPGWESPEPSQLQEFLFERFHRISKGGKSGPPLASASSQPITPHQNKASPDPLWLPTWPSTHKTRTRSSLCSTSCTRGPTNHCPHPTQSFLDQFRPDVNYPGERESYSSLKKIEKKKVNCN